MEKITRAEAIKRWESAKAQKKVMVEKMRKMLYEDYKARTGEEPLTFNVSLFPQHYNLMFFIST